MTRAVVAAMVAAAGLTMVAAPVDAAPGDGTSKTCHRLLWSGDVGVGREIHIADADGAKRTTVSDFGVGSPTSNGFAEWSADGSRVAWVGDGEIWVANADGTNRTKISDTSSVGPDPTGNLSPQWSPDGARVAWAGNSGPTYQIYVADSAGGTNRTIISDVSDGTDPTNNFTPQWSPDGTRIAWTGNDVIPTPQIWAADADGQNRIKISNGPAGSNIHGAQWSPDGTRIAWSGDSGATSHIWVADADGTDRATVSDADTDPDPIDNTDVQWSPDGSRLAWAGRMAAMSHIWVADANGLNREPISDVGSGPDPTDNALPTWSPDGFRIAWQGLAGGVGEIWAANADGTNRVNVSDADADPDPTNNALPQWRPRVPTPLTDIGSSFARADIDCLYALGITQGATPTTYEPGGTVTREQMAAFLARLWRNLGGTCDPTPPPFTDAATSFAADDIACLYNHGITKGATPTTYDPGGQVTREQMAAFLARIWRSLGGTCDPTPPPLTDISTSFARDDIACLYNLAITKGLTPTTYDPGTSVSREQMAAFLNRLHRTATSA